MGGHNFVQRKDRDMPFFLLNQEFCLVLFYYGYKEINDNYFFPISTPLPPIQKCLKFDPPYTKNGQNLTPYTKNARIWSEMAKILSKMAKI